ncbi:MAG: copper resistance protein CopC [Actinobacteria bacterium]|nr:copper resistance protein CopC [Actinomycetota bacterium]
MTIRTLRRIVGAAIASTALALAFIPGIASAHAILESSSPEASALLASSPKEIRLDFDEQVEATLGDVRVYDSEQREVSKSNTVRSASDASVVTAKVSTLKNGVYVVVWRVVSADGHPVTGAFPFEIGTKSTGTSAALLEEVLNRTETTSPLGNPMSFFRLLGFLGLILLIGCVSLLWRSPLLGDSRVRKTMQYSSVLVAVSSLGLLLTQGPYTAGKSWGSLFDSVMIGDVLQTRLGLALFVRTICALAWGVIALTASASVSRRWRIGVIAAAVITITTYAASGHQSAGTLPGIFVPLDMIHLAAISTWVGALLVLAAIHRDNDVEIEAKRFSRMATWSMPVVVATGVVQGLHLMGGISNITQSSFGKLLLAKTLLVACVVLLGSKARGRLEASGFSSISKIIRWESTVVVLVLAVTSLMVAQSPNAKPAIPISFSATKVQNGIVAELSVVPAVVGTAEVHVILTPPGGSLTPAKSVTVQFDLPSRNIPPIPVKLTEIGPNHWIGIVQFPFSGAWNMNTRVSPAPNQTLLFSTVVTVQD